MINNPKVLPISEFYNAYSKEKQIDAGAFSKVFICKSNADQKKYAVKVAKITADILKYINIEIDINSRLKEKSAKNVMYAYNMYQDKMENEIYYLLPYCNGKNMDKKIENIGHASEDEAQYYVRKLVTGINWMHKQNFMHRDIKPANIMLHRMEGAKSLVDYENYEIYLCDFGLSKTDDLAHTTLGTPITMAPEVRNGRKEAYDNKADIWSVGIVLYFMLMGNFPYNDQTSLKTLEKQVIKIPRSRCLSLACLSFMEMCLQYDKIKRLSADKLLDHPFIKNDDVPYYLKAPLTDLCSKEWNVIDHQKQYCTDLMNKAENQHSIKGSVIMN